MRILSLVGVALTLSSAPVFAQDINFGNDSSQWAKNGECDDRRFVGSTMTNILNNEDLGRDATDCREGYDAGKLKLWNNEAALKVTQCDAIDFGDNSSDFADDDECDDPRFEGLGMASSVSSENVGMDANDCRRFCETATVAVREY